jgi:hypothetical protein
MTPVTTNPALLDFDAIEQIRAKARIERSKAFWAIWTTARDGLTRKFASGRGADRFAQA